MGPVAIFFNFLSEEFYFAPIWSFLERSSSLSSRMFTKLYTKLEVA